MVMAKGMQNREQTERRASREREPEAEIERQKCVRNSAHARQGT